MNLTKYAMAASMVAAPLLFAAPASATDHVDPCEGQHVQVWSEVGNSGAGQATNHFVCGQVGRDGKDGKDGSDSTVPGPQGPAGPAGENGLDSVVPGPTGADGADGAQGPQGPAGVDGVAVEGAMGPMGPTGPSGGSGMDGARGPRGLRGGVGVDGVTKTVYITRIVHEDGTVTETPVDALPATGSDMETFWLALAAFGLVGTGVVIYTIFRR